MQFLPAYSPELNPCELVFGMVKNALRARGGVECLTEDIIDAFGAVSMENMINFYRHCLSTRVIFYLILASKCNL